jgi:hypothetical protein
VGSARIEKLERRRNPLKAAELMEATAFKLSE